MKLHKGWRPGLAELPAPTSLELSQALMGRGCQSWTIASLRSASHGYVSLRAEGPEADREAFHAAENRPAG